MLHQGAETPSFQELQLGVRDKETGMPPFFTDANVTKGC